MRYKNLLAKVLYFFEISKFWCILSFDTKKKRNPFLDFSLCTNLTDYRTLIDSLQAFIEFIDWLKSYV